jgi:hypothetical protein
MTGGRVLDCLLVDRLVVYGLVLYLLVVDRRWVG